MDERATDGSGRRGSTSRLGSDDLGRVFGGLFVASVASFVLSSIGTAALSASSLEDDVPFAADDLFVAGVLGSWVGVWASLLAYGAWSFRRLRRLPVERSRPVSRNPIVRGYELLALVFADLDGLTTYEKRLQLTVQAVVFGLLACVGPAFLVLSGAGRGVTVLE